MILPAVGTSQWEATLPVSSTCIDKLQRQPFPSHGPPGALLMELGLGISERRDDIVYSKIGWEAEPA